MIQPIHSMPLYVCGENFSRTQGWIEGALETSEIVIEKMIPLFSCDTIKRI